MKKKKKKKKKKIKKGQFNGKTMVFKIIVKGSNPFSRVKDMVEMVDTQDLGPCNN